MWDTHLPRHEPRVACKAVAYTCKALGQTQIVHNNTTHPLLNPNLIVLNIWEEDSILACIVNTYHATDSHKHSLDYLLSHELDEFMPTILISDFNSHSSEWLVLGRTPSS
jgi:hypothetical protein